MSWRDRDALRRHPANFSPAYIGMMENRQRDGGGRQSSNPFGGFSRFAGSLGRRFDGLQDRFGGGGEYRSGGSAYQVPNRERRPYQQQYQRPDTFAGLGGRSSRPYGGGGMGERYDARGAFRGFDARDSRPYGGSIFRDRHDPRGSPYLGARTPRNEVPNYPYQFHQNRSSRSSFVTRGSHLTI
ncbi:hypothetical protein B0A48_07421 [Cryoendolithus antarcticus]|uniref:Uncharacterized protein n=1 Tax=Cryoendolithus antarcticus TaxID=1507870 RepID=A0A1V8T8W8_9PEZI|nr:hypothetical protein B0A48_07421 [Cryoendolithus antarcticus]